jgi:hypothetical protein
MEDRLDLYELPYEPKPPMVCLDEKSKSLLGELNCIRQNQFDQWQWQATIRNMSAMALAIYW